MKFRSLVLLSLLLIFSIRVDAQNSLPATPTGKLAALFVQMLNSAGDDPLKEFIRDRMTPNPDITFDQRVERFRGIRNDLGGAKVLSFIGETEKNILFIIETAKGETLRLDLGVSPDPEKRIAGLPGRSTFHRSPRTGSGETVSRG
jgi:hypothetical protein